MQWSCGNGKLCSSSLQPVLVEFKEIGTTMYWLYGRHSYYHRLASYRAYRYSHAIYIFIVMTFLLQLVVWPFVQCYMEQVVLMCPTQNALSHWLIDGLIDWLIDWLIAIFDVICDLSFIYAATMHPCHNNFGSKFVWLKINSFDDVGMHCQWPAQPPVSVCMQLECCGGNSVIMHY